jgi:hypothetical protein
MTMHLNKIDHDTIHKMGCWSSDTFLMYIHKQIAAFSSGLSKKMSTEIGWHNIEGPTVMDEPAQQQQHNITEIAHVTQH